MAMFFIAFYEVHLFNLQSKSFKTLFEVLKEDGVGF
jgi:hypothetical protein